MQLLDQVNVLFFLLSGRQLNMEVEREVEVGVEIEVEIDFDDAVDGY